MGRKDISLEGFSQGQEWVSVLAVSATSNIKGVLSLGQQHSILSYHTVISLIGGCFSIEFFPLFCPLIFFFESKEGKSTKVLLFVNIPLYTKYLRELMFY